MALSGIRVIELAGLAPGPFCGMILSDFNAEVIRVDRHDTSSSLDVLDRGKKSIAMNLKSPEGVKALLKILAKADVVIEPFRPGVMEKLGLGPKIVMEINPNIIYARLTGFGQTGPYANMAGHDINYAAISGALSVIGRQDENPIFPGNILADFAGGGMTCAMGIAFALLERSKSGKGQVIDSAMVDGSAYLSTFIYKNKYTPLWDQERGTNVLDSGAHFYEVYKTKDGKYVSVGAIEPQFYSKLLQGMGLSNEDLPDQMDKSQWNTMKDKFKKIFETKTRDEWSSIFDGTDACVAPVLEMNEIQNHPHNIARSLMATNDTPNPAPRLSRTPGTTQNKHSPQIGQHSQEVLNSFGFSEKEIQDLLKSGSVVQSKLAKL